MTVVVTSLLFLLLAYQSSAVLECYTGYSVMKGSTIGSETKKCGKDTDYCYNATAHVTSFSTLQTAGCNTLICQFNGNKCFEQVISDKNVTFCCCNDANLCNGGEMVESGSMVGRGLSVLKGMMSFMGKK
ncbi:unnamed protein product [Auanema sp. JU1783]|nr:unnamed protein product [Auanema sp. JU1783]